MRTAKRVIRFAILTSLMVSTMLLNACHADASKSTASPEAVPNAVRVASKLDNEGALLGNMIVLMLEANGIPVVNQVQMGSSKIVRSALINGEIDVYPEYTGNAAVMFNMDNHPVWKNAQASYDLVKKLDYDANKIVWLNRASANNNWAIAIRSELAQSNKIRTVEDLARYVNQGGFFKFASSTEFIERSNALAVFEKNYHFKLKPDQFLPMAGGNSAEFIAAASEQRLGTNAALVYGTDGTVSEHGLIVLEDNKGVEPIFNPAPIIREDCLIRYPQISKLLNPVFDSLDTQTLKQLNAQVSSENVSPNEVARLYLQSNHFLK